MYADRFAETCARRAVQRSLTPSPPSPPFASLSTLPGRSYCLRRRPSLEGACLHPVSVGHNLLFELSLRAAALLAAWPKSAAVASPLRQGYCTGGHIMMLSAMHMLMTKLPGMRQLHVEEGCGASAHSPYLLPATVTLSAVWTCIECCPPCPGSAH
eukprot:354234-Chlamydomonas_euryale.AAC.4